MYKSPGGIFPDEKNPGFKNVILKPHFVKGLETFSAMHNGPYGKIVSSWKREAGDVLYHVEIPANSTATITLKAASVKIDGDEITDSGSLKVKRNDDGTFFVTIKSGKKDFTISE